jgi:hypothetical protein
MANTIRIKRRAGTGSAGAPSSLKNAELAYNEADDILYYGKGSDGSGDATSIPAIAGAGAYLTLGTSQTVTGDKTFSGAVSVATPSSNAHAATKLYVDTAVSGVTVSGTANQITVTSGVVSLASSVTTPGDLTVTGNLTVNGTTTTVNSTTVSLDDKNIELASTSSPSDAGADGAGITVKGTTDKTFNWVDATDAWTSSEHLNLLTGKSFYINGTAVLSSSTLGSGITSSSLTSVGTIATGVWQGTAIGIAYGGTGATTASGARTALELGSIATQNANNVNITGGTIDGISIDGGTF